MHCSPRHSHPMSASADTAVNRCSTTPLGLLLINFEDPAQVAALLADLEERIDRFRGDDMCRPVTSTGKRWRTIEITDRRPREEYL